MNVSRGDIVLVAFPFSSGRGGKLRPAVVVQADALNARVTNTVIAGITTTTKRVARAATQVLVDPTAGEGAASGLLHISAITCENLYTVESAQITRKIGVASASIMLQVNEALKAALGVS
ncbi:MAG: type II toxin-antitoxin system PemK/MazF family toxin [Pirellulales bacterium]|nr:type II toxin-antitoxin system PemK/MazF family toxin [Pirellulales bacterium]